MKEVQEHGVCYGFLPKLPPAREGRTVIASGKAAVPGVNAKVQPLVKPAIVSAPSQKKVGEDLVDFRELGRMLMMFALIPVDKGTP